MAVGPMTTPNPASVHPLLRFFEYEHLPQGQLRSTSRRIHGLAHFLAGDLPDGAEKTVGLRKLLEAKDCFVRAAVPEPDHGAQCSPPLCMLEPGHDGMHLGAGFAIGNDTVFVEPCPECIAGKCGNCDGSSWDHAGEQPAPCPCASVQHPRRTS
jgi:hypothetical protein